MSSGVIVITPAAVGFAAGAFVVITAAGAAVLIARAAGAAAEGTVRVLGEHGEQLERLANEQYDAELQAMVWESVAAEVVELNARIRMLTERAKRSNAVVAVPAPLNLSGATTADAVEWSVQAAEALRSAQATVHAAVVADEGRSIAAKLPPSAADRPDTAAALARFQSALTERYAEQRIPLTPRNDRVAAVEKELRTLDVDANEPEHAGVLRAAALVTTDDPRESATYLRTLRTKIGDVNAVVARRRLAAQWLSALEDPVMAGTDLPEPFAGTAAKLRAVVAGDHDMDTELRAEGAQAVDWAADVTRQRFVDSVMRDCLADLGYTVDTETRDTETRDTETRDTETRDTSTGHQGADLHRPAEVRVTRSTWHDEHHARIWVDKHGRLQGRLVREYPAEGDEAALRDKARCAEFNGTLLELGVRLPIDEVRVDEHHVPLVAGARQPEVTVQDAPIARER